MKKKIKKVIKGLEKASKLHAKQAKVLKSGLKVFKARGGGMDMGNASNQAQSASMGGGNNRSSTNRGSDHSHSRFDAGSGYYGGNKTTSGNGGSSPSGSKRKIGGPDTTKDTPYKSNTALNLLAGALKPGSGFLTEGLQRKAYKDRQKYARKEGLYREYYIGNQYKTDPSARVLKPNSPEGKAFIKEAKPAPKPTLGGGDNGGSIPRCPDGTLPPCTKVASAPKLPMGKAKVEPKMFEFNFNQGGLVRGAGKILKNRNRKVRIF